MKKYTIIGGINGVGKSSLSGVLSQDYSNLGIIIDTDKIIAKFGGEKIKGGKEAIRLISDCLTKGINFTQETTLSGKKTLKTVEAARNKGYYIRLFYIGISSAEESLQRIENRVRKGGHNIPSDDVVRRFQNRFEDLAKVLPYCDEVHFFDNENGFVYVCEYRNGQLFTIGDYIPGWIKALKDYLDKTR